MLHAKSYAVCQWESVFWERNKYSQMVGLQADDIDKGIHVPFHFVFLRFNADSFCKIASSAKVAKESIDTTPSQKSWKKNGSTHVGFSISQKPIKKCLRCPLTRYDLWVTRWMNLCLPMASLNLNKIIILNRSSTVLETPGIPVTGTPSIHSPCHEELFSVEEC